MVRDILELGSSLGFLDEMFDQFQAQPGAEQWRFIINLFRRDILQIQGLDNLCFQFRRCYAHGFTS